MGLGEHIPFLHNRTFCLGRQKWCVRHNGVWGSTLDFSLGSILFHHSSALFCWLLVCVLWDAQASYGLEMASVQDVHTDFCISRYPVYPFVEPLWSPVESHMAESTKVVC